MAKAAIVTGVATALDVKLDTGSCAIAAIVAGVTVALVESAMTTRGRVAIVEIVAGVDPPLPLAVV